MADPPPDDIAAALGAVRARIASALRSVNRPPDDATLVAVSKTHGAEAVEAALAAGQRVFGENRVQEAASKFPALRDRFPTLRLHLIGPLQTNKAEDAIRLADVIETLDRPKLADALTRAGDRLGRIPGLLVQVNIGDEPQKAGVATTGADQFIDDCQTTFGRHLLGLMCIPPNDTDPAPFFTALAAMRQRHGLPVLSMGMSGDFETAIRLGATHVRVGSAVFGTRG